MKKTNLQEELKRIHEITYGKTSINEDFIDKLLSKVGLGKKVDDPKKADLVTPDVAEFYKTIEEAISSGGLSQKGKGSMEYQKNVESMQIGLIMLGYELPKHGVDGLFGPETANAVRDFKRDNLKLN
jgi:peptidoglycan hydrolase-like protein with peptidoglycan-binding domain